VRAKECAPSPQQRGKPLGCLPRQFLGTRANAPWSSPLVPFTRYTVAEQHFKLIHYPSLTALAIALRTDLDWIRKHTRIGEAALEGCAEGSDERELAAITNAITNAIEAYEAARWPNGMVSGGKG
jgi:hypothetical protein